MFYTGINLPVNLTRRYKTADGDFIFVNRMTIDQAVFHFKAPTKNQQYNKTDKPSEGQFEKTLLEAIAQTNR